MDDLHVWEKGPALFYNERGVLHRDDGPARIDGPDEPGGPPGMLEWWVDGERHRAGAPARVFGNREIPAQWFFEGDGYAGAETYISEWLEEYHPRTTWELDEALEDAVHPWVEGRTLEDLYQQIVAVHPLWDLDNWELEGPSRRDLPGGGVRDVDENGRVRYFDGAGKRHRDDGPAVWHPEEESWWRHGVVHRVGGPAVTQSDGSMQWVQEDVLHRVDGPAIVRQAARWHRWDRWDQWFLRGEEASFPEVLSAWLDQEHPGWDESLRKAMWVAMEVWPPDATMAELYAEVTGGAPSGAFLED